MGEIDSLVIQNRSKIFYSYSTIKMTSSRVDKGLIAIPRSLADWFRKNDIKAGDEIVIQLMDREEYIYRLVPENKFLLETKELQKSFDSSENEREASSKLEHLAYWISTEKTRVVLSEYRRLLDAVPIKRRNYIEKPSVQVRESVTANFRTLLRYLYRGHCQLCDFTFLKKDNSPYFEIHHINSSIENRPKNLIVVCANCHRQFEYANVSHKFTSDGWLAKVSFNNREHSINQFANN